MAVFRIEKARDYTVMSNHHLRNTNLSLKAKGLLSLILKLVNALILNTKGEGEKSSEDFWVSATRSLAVRSQQTNNKICCLDNW